MSPEPRDRSPRGRSGVSAGRGRPDAGAGRGAGGRPPARTARPREDADALERVRTPSPPLFDEAQPDLLDSRVRESLSVLGDELALRVGRHLAAAGLLLDDDPETALEHARYARARAARVAEVREALGVAAYVAGDYTLARAELRTVRRMSGSLSTVPLLADCERALGRPREALALAATPGVERLDREDQLELVMVAAGARLDLGEPDQALRVLAVPELAAELGGRGGTDDPSPTVLRLHYVRAEALLAAGDRAGARRLFAQVAVYGDELTDADEREQQLLDETVT